MKRLRMYDIVQEVQLLIEDWHCTKCPDEYTECNKGCPHYKLCSALLTLSNIKVQNYDSNGELRK